MHDVSAKTRFVQKQNLHAIVLSPAVQRRIGLFLPQSNRFGISLVRTLQSFLRHQLQLRQQLADRHDARINPNFRAISSASIARVHTNPIRIAGGSRSLTPRNGCRSWATVKLRGRPVPTSRTQS